jgi:predicted nucleic acid-binding protein
VALIDASALASYVLKEEGSGKIREYLAQGVMSVELVIKETANAILMATKRKMIGSQQFEIYLGALKALLKSNIKLVDQRDILEESFKIALKNDLTIYDAIYITSAKKQKIPLLTCDKRQAKVAKGEGIDVIEM